MNTIAHVVTCLQIGGLERVVVNLVHGFRGHDYRQLVICLEDGGPFVAEVEALGTEVIVIGKKPGRSWSTIRQLATLFRQERVTIVHTHNPAPHFHGVLAAVLAGVPVRVHTKHGRNYPHLKKAVLLNRILSWFTDAIVPVSDNAGDVALHVEKVNPRKIRRIWNGVDVGLYKPVESRESKVEGRIPHPSTLSSPTTGLNPQLSTIDLPSPISHRQLLTIGTVARLSPEKDQKTMLQAFKLVLDQWPQPALSPQLSTLNPKLPSSNLRPLTADLLPIPRLVIIGDGPCLAELQAAAQRLGVASHVGLLGARSDIPTQLSTFDVFTLSSITEGISLTILEAMACGIPIVASDVGGNREIVQPPLCGLIVPARDPQALAAAYLELLNDPNQRVRMGSAGCQRVGDNFSLQTMVRHYRDLYEELLNNKSVGISK
ncbi:MAG: glycosyltransferase [Verrucomicrobiota bacterium]